MVVILIHRFVLLILLLFAISYTDSKYLRDNNHNIDIEDSFKNDFDIEDYSLRNDIDIEETLNLKGYHCDKTRTHSGTYNIVRYFSKQNSNIVLRETKDAVFEKYWYNKEINETKILSDLLVAPHLYMAGYTDRNHGFMISDRYDYTLYELACNNKNRKVFIRYESEIRQQIHSLLNRMIYNASIYNSDMKIENIVVKIFQSQVDIRMIDFDSYYSKTSFDVMHKFEYHYLIDISKARTKMFQTAFYCLCLIFLEEHLRQYSNVFLFKEDIAEFIQNSNYSEEHILAMSYIYYSDFMELIRAGYYSDKSLYFLITDNIDKINLIRYSSVVEKINILVESRPIQKTEEYNNSRHLLFL